MIIKVCGMRDADNIRAVSALSVDMIGLIFWPQSPRYVRMINSRSGIIPDKAGEGVVDDGLARPKLVGVFVDEMPQNIVTRVYNYTLDYVQLHGHESPTMIDNLRRTLDPDIRPDIKIIKAVSVGCADDVERCRDYEGCVDMLLFDTRTPKVGGSGEQFDWSVLEAYTGNVPFLLSGGIGPDDAGRVLRYNHPQLAGIDINSRFETSPGIKDVEKVRQFVDTIKQK